MAIQKATRKRVRLRMALDGPSGSGKTFTGLLFAHALTKRYGGKIGVINSERERLYSYADLPLPDGDKLEFYADDLRDGDPQAYISSIAQFEREGGFTAVLIDSLSHAWAGDGGALEQKDKEGGNSFTAWAKITPLHNRMVSRIIGAPFHIIATMRSKPAYVLELNEKGKQEPKRIGMEPIQRKGVEYEYGIFGSMDLDHRIRITKSDCSSVDGISVLKPDGSFMDPIMDWMEVGKSEPVTTPVERIATREMVSEYLSMMVENMGGKTTSADVEQTYWNLNHHEVWHGPYEKIAALLATLRSERERKKAKAAATQQS
jgi:hypothetical protein